MKEIPVKTNKYLQDNNESTVLSGEWYGRLNIKRINTVAVKMVFRRRFSRMSRKYNNINHVKRENGHETFYFGR
jgi:hypothetical protein